jgi:hypothetical protein
MTLHRRRVANGIARWIVIAVYVETALFLILTLGGALRGRSAPAERVAEKKMGEAHFL